MATTREQFVGRVRRALGRKRPASPAPTPPAVDERVVRLAGEESASGDRFVERAEAVGLRVERTTAARLVPALLNRLKALEAKRVVTSAGSMAQSAEINEALRRAGMEVLDWRGDRTMDACYEADVGVTDAVAGLAETGTLVCRSGPGQGRGLWLAPPRHVAILRASDLLPDLLDYLKPQDGRAPRDLPAGQCLITGPSKTADIEGVLITGVHGPGGVDVLFVTDA